MVSELRRWVMMYKKWNALKKSWKATKQDRPQEMQMFSIMGITSSFSCVSPWARTYRFALLLCCIEYRSWYIKDLRLRGYGTYLVQSKHCSLIRKSRFWPKKKRVSYYVRTLRKYIFVEYTWWNISLSQVPAKKIFLLLDVFFFLLSKAFQNYD